MATAADSDLQITYDKHRGALQAHVDGESYTVILSKRYENQDEMLKDLVRRYLRNIDASRARNRQYASRIRNDEEMRLRYKEMRAAWFQQNKERLRQRQNERYNSATSSDSRPEGKINWLTRDGRPASKESEEGGQRELVNVVSVIYLF
jgi:hypothetical protein